MTHALLAGLVVIAGGVVSAVATSAPVPTSSAQPRQQPAICCCRIYQQRWQYSWMPPDRCQQSNGTCVAPDHC
jgi:hypothetical protein